MNKVEFYAMQQVIFDICNVHSPIFSKSFNTTSFKLSSVLRRVHSFSQNDSSTECDLLCPHTIPIIPLVFEAILFLHLRHPITAILPSFLPSITCSGWQFLRKMWPIHLAYLLFIVRGLEL